RPVKRLSQVPRAQSAGARDVRDAASSSTRLMERVAAAVLEAEVGRAHFGATARRRRDNAPNARPATSITSVRGSGVGLTGAGLKVNTVLPTRKLPPPVSRSDTSDAVPWPARFAVNSGSPARSRSENPESTPLIVKSVLNEPEIVAGTINGNALKKTTTTRKNWNCATLSGSRYGWMCHCDGGPIGRR